jgi:hypothetical protein
MAANKGPGKANALFAAWVKPVTLAATIALSLAIVLELSEVPVTSVPLEVVPAVESRGESVREGLLEELVLKDTDLAKREAKSKTESFAASPPATDPPAARKRAAEMPDANQPAALMLNVDQKAAKRLVSTEPVATLGLSMEINDSYVTAACDEKARRSADSWLDCIDQLRESGATLDADREYESFVLEYPTRSADSESNK